MVSKGDLLSNKANHFHLYFDFNYIAFCIVLFLDIDECDTDTDNCHIDANCSNTKGSFYCTCKTGYSGNGVVCEGNKYIVSITVQVTWS